MCEEVLGFEKLSEILYVCQISCILLKKKSRLQIWVQNRSQFCPGDGNICEFWIIKTAFESRALQVACTLKSSGPRSNNRKRNPHQQVGSVKCAVERRAHSLVPSNAEQLCKTFNVALHTCLSVSFTHSLAAADFSLLFCLPARTAAKAAANPYKCVKRVWSILFCVPCCGRSPNSMPLCMFLHLTSIFSIIPLKW